MEKLQWVQMMEKLLDSATMKLRRTICVVYLQKRIKS